MKKPKKDTPKCPFYSSHPTIKKGLRKSKKRQTQKYQCKNSHTTNHQLQTKKECPQRELI